MKRISHETIAKLEWESTDLDMRFVDDHPKEVDAILDAQLASCEKEHKEELEKARIEERKKVGEWLENEMTKVPHISDPNAECNVLNGLISKLLEALKSGEEVKMNEKVRELIVYTS